MLFRDLARIHSLKLHTGMLWGLPKTPEPLTNQEALAHFLNHHEPRIRAALSQPSLLAKWDLGAGYNFVRERPIAALLHPEQVREGRISFKNFFFERYQIDPFTGTQEISVASQIASRLHRSWIEEHPFVPIRTAIEIVKGDPPFAPWICWILYQEAHSVLVRSTKMAKVARGLRRHFLAWPPGPIPSPEEILHWIYQLHRGEPLTSSVHDRGLAFIRTLLQEPAGAAK